MDVHLIERNPSSGSKRLICSIVRDSFTPSSPSTSVMERMVGTTGEGAQGCRNGKEQESVHRNGDLTG